MCQHRRVPNYEAINFMKITDKPLKCTLDSIKLTRSRSCIRYCPRGQGYILVLNCIKLSKVLKI